MAVTKAPKAPSVPTGPRTAPITSAAVKIEITLPERKRGNASTYPFDTLVEPGMVFGVKGKPAKNLSSVISNVNKRFVKTITDEHGNPTFETKPMHGPDGSVMQVPDTSKPKTHIERKFRAIDVTPDIAKSLKGTPLEGFDTLIQRTI